MIYLRVLAFMTTDQKFERTILIDEPSREDQFHGKGHERTAAALARAITSMAGHDRAIGLDGPWGSGKSTVVEIACNVLIGRHKKGEADYRFFNFDIWQSQGSSFRRSFLEHFLDWAIATFPHKRSKLEAIERDVKGKVREVQSKNQSMLDWWGVLVIAAIPFLPIYYFWAKSVFDDKNRSESFACSSPMLLLYLFVGLTLCWAALKCYRDRGTGTLSWRNFPSQYRQALSQTLLINSKQFENQKVTQYIRETDPNDFEFQTSLRRILSVVQSRDSKVVIVLDNIDRLPRKEINEYWAQVRAVFSNGPTKSQGNPDSSVIAIVPYDRHLVEEVTKPKNEIDENGKTATAAISSLSTREIFSKTFDEILQVSPPVMSNSRDFFLEKITKALPGATDRDELFRVFLIFDHILRNENGKATPRQIIAFINELTGMYILHDGRFRIPTVAVYIAHADSLEANPAKLNDRNSIDEKLRALAADPKLEQNLAAMIFNVEPELALQLLLDDRIEAAVLESAESLISISKAPGFDLRVDAVIQNYVEEWEQSETFPSVISNFADLAKSYDGDARSHFCKSLVAAVMRLGTIRLAPKVYEPVLRIFEVARSEDRGRLAVSITKSVSNSWADTFTVETGQSWAKFVGELNRRLDGDSGTTLLANAMAAVTYPTSPHFVFGAASKATEEGITIDQLRIPKPDTSTDEAVFATLAVQRPSEARSAFRSLSQRSTLTLEQMSGASAALVNAIAEAEIDDPSEHLSRVELLAEIYTYVPSANRGELEISTLFGQSKFYKELFECMETSSDASFGAALFLAIMIFKGSAPPVPTTRSANGGRVADKTDEYDQFVEAFTDAKVVSVEQFQRAAELAKLAASSTLIVNYGASAPDNPLLKGIVRHMFVEGSKPLITLSSMLPHYAYVRTTLGPDVETALQKYASSASENELEKLTLDSIPTAIVSDVINLSNFEWRRFIEKVKTLLQSVSTDTWIEHLIASNDTSHILLEVIDGTDFEFSDPTFRDVYVELIVGLLAARYSVVNTARFDPLLGSMGAKFQSDILRSIREQMRDVNASNLEFATKIFPNTLSKLVTGADRLTRQEKDNLVRFILCPALEGAIRPILSDFEKLGRTKVSDMIKQSEKSTQEKLQGASEIFSRISGDLKWTKSISELLYGKRQSKSLFDKWFRKTVDQNRDEIEG
ncbi:hypothetical protein RS75_20405 [Rhizobium nepotum 39/7]|uniref:KAP NTPase domain-containing protein n=2 Tax=Rhizobium nepotum TaxID=1035271 RepID=A0ABR5CME8_9HYPH|nr:hypothetical protein RS75_20405 [Rhizobium nepotum 39/7]